MQKIVLLLLSLTLVTVHSALAEIFKCLDEKGTATYRDTSCVPGETHASIDRRFANSIPMKFPEEDAETITELAEETRTKAARRVEHRNSQIRAIAEEIRRKQARCDELKHDVQALETTQRRFGRSDPNAKRHLIGQMRKVCSS